MRGISGSGKSTLARELGKGGVVLSTDDYFVDPITGEYKWAQNKLKPAHEWNQNRALEAFHSGISPVVIDNTHTKKWEAKFYVERGLDAGYTVLIREPDTPWKWDPVELAKRNSHGVGVDAIARMIERWDHDFTVENILAS